ncbi:MAG: nitrogenase molybdenum-iron protein alpha chain [Candidatus Methanoperedenaceae archaeon]|nr:nitrogenase molybdenum-iron protein alpha chain [Candidatus Methanoperedenaceae archaeon]
MLDTEKSSKCLDTMLSHYPEKVGKNRKEHLVAIDSCSEQHIEANAKVIPGILTNRGCAYAGCKGVVFGPVKDILDITHGPIGCSYFTWGTRRNWGKAEEDGDNYLNYCLSTDMQEQDIVFGGEKKLREAIREAYDIFKPEAIGVYSTCPVGLIGDDVKGIAREMSEELGILVIPNRCEGYRGISQSAGHHLASNTLMEYLVGTEDLEDPTPFDINVFGEYNIGGDYWGVKPLFEKIGYRIVTPFTGDASFHGIAKAHKAKLSVLMCHRSINYTNRMMEEKFGVPWMKINYIGIDGTIETLRNMAKFFDDPDLTARTEEVIKEELERVMPEFGKYRKRLAGKKVVIYSGGSRSHHYINLFESLGMEVIVSGYQFAHRDDYEGRQILPHIKKKASSKILEDVRYEQDPDIKPTYSKEELEKMKARGVPLMEYDGMLPEMKDGSWAIDDMSHYETEYILEKLKPDLYCSGIKDKYYSQKLGVPSRQIHSYDYSGPYSGFEGALNFARDVDMALSSPTWKYVTPPWKSGSKTAFMELSDRIA